MRSIWLALCGANGFLAVAAGAFGAHALRERLPSDLLEIWNTAAHYHLVHALALGLCAWLGETRGGALPRWAGRCFTVGLLLFSGSLYALALSGVRGLGAVTPLGGLAFLAGWLCVALCARRPAPELAR
ncbi:MAG: DUF423 domain-containing protein [Planctomycetes bacterium]|nr:DUF423 domain-containing protein [Planctomycetota bacterium]